MTNASAKPEIVLLLVENCDSPWGWEDEAIRLLWISAKDPIKGEVALDTLYKRFAGKMIRRNSIAHEKGTPGLDPSVIWATLHAHRPTSSNH